MMPPPCALTRAPEVSLRLIPGGLGGAMGFAVSGSVKTPICEPGATVQLVTASAVVVVVGVPEPRTSPSSFVPHATNAKQTSDEVQRRLETLFRIDKCYHARAHPSSRINAKLRTDALFRSPACPTWGPARRRHG